MKEVCFCGRIDHLGNRGLVWDKHGEQALRCSSCGHLDYLRWLPTDLRLQVFEEAYNGRRGSGRYVGERAG